jgi:hypothetical protein
MAWTHTYTPHLEGASNDVLGWARGSHDGYANAGGAIHRRTVWLRPGGYLLICDEITARPGHEACANYQFAPGLLTLDADTALFDERFEISWSCSVPITATLISDGGGPGGGWIAPSLGVRERAPRLQLAFSLSSSRVVLLAILADRRRAGDGRSRRVFFPPVIPLQNGAIVAARVDGVAWEDHVVTNADGSPMECSGIETDAALAVIRLSGGAVEDLRRIGGTYLRVRKSDFFVTPKITSPAVSAAI